MVQTAEGDLMTVKCKLFYKKEAQFVELGVGVLHVRSPDEGSGVCLLLRNNTTIGKILLNVRLCGQEPLSVQKNNVLLVCVPNPPLDSTPVCAAEENGEQSKPVTYLLRVKDNNLASQLQSTIQQNLK